VKQQIIKQTYLPISNLKANAQLLSAIFLYIQAISP